MQVVLHCLNYNITGNNSWSAEWSHEEDVYYSGLGTRLTLSHNTDSRSCAVHFYLINVHNAETIFTSDDHIAEAF